MTTGRPTRASWRALGDLVAVVALAAASAVPIPYIEDVLHAASCAQHAPRVVPRRPVAAMRTLEAQLPRTVPTLTVSELVERLHVAPTAVNPPNRVFPAHRRR